MQRRAVVVTGAVAELELVDEVLGRFGFAPLVVADGFDAALARVREERVDLLLVPLAQAEGLALASLERAIRQHEGTFVIGLAPRAESALIVQAMRAGVHEFLLSPPDPTELAGAVDRLMRRGSREASRGSIVAIYSAKGGLGTTSLAVNLAFALARQETRARVALADFVLGGGDVRVLLDLKVSYDIGDLVARMQRVDADLLTSILTPVEGGVWVLPSTERPEVTELVDATAASAVLEQLRGNFPYTVVDCEHHLTERTLAALDAADRVLLVTQLTVPALRSAQRTLALAERLGYDDEKVRVVVNRNQSGDVISLKDAGDLLERDVFAALPNEYRASEAAQARGLPLLLHEPASRLAVAYNDLAARVAGSPYARNGKPPVRGSRIGRLLGFGKH